MGTPFSISALKADMAAGPLAPQVAPHAAAGRCEDVAILYNAPGAYACPQPYLPIATVLIWAASGPLDAMEAAAADAQLPAAARSAARAFLKMFGLPSITTFNPLGAAESAMTAGLVAASVLAQAEVDALVALCQVPCSYAESAWGRGTVVTHQQVAAALNS